MKYSVWYEPKFRYIESVDVTDLMIPFYKYDIESGEFTTEQNYLELFTELHKKYPDKTITIVVQEHFFYSDVNGLGKILEYAAANPEHGLKLMVPLLTPREEDYEVMVAALKKFNTLKIKYSFSDNISNLSILNVALDLRPYEVTITETLGFDILDLSRYIHDKGVKVRIIPNVVQSPYPIFKLNHFFIRPDDIDLYDEVADVAEVYAMRDDYNTASIIFKAYALDKKWFGKLNEIIVGLDSEIDSRYIFPAFGERRMRCKQNCFSGGKCNMCFTIEELADTLEENGMLVSMIDK